MPDSADNLAVDACFCTADTLYYCAHRFLRSLDLLFIFLRMDYFPLRNDFQSSVGLLGASDRVYRPGPKVPEANAIRTGRRLVLR